MTYFDIGTLHNKSTREQDMVKHHWYKLKKRLEDIMAPNLNISFNYSPLRKKTNWSEITLRFFQIKLDDEIIWQFPKDTNQVIDENFIYGQSKFDNQYINIEFPIQSITAYLNLPKEKLFNYEDKSGIAEILKVCDKRIGYNRLKTLKLSHAGTKIFEKRFSNKG